MTTALSTSKPKRSCSSRCPDVHDVEAVFAALMESDERLVEELADLWFHSYVLLAARGLDPAAVEDELTRRAKHRSSSEAIAE